MMTWLRRISQIVFFVLFFKCLFMTHEKLGTDLINPSVKMFFDIDPLIALSTVISSHKLLATSACAAVILVVTALFGRIFCGFVCPFGTINHFFGWLKRRTAAKPVLDAYEPSQRVKYLLLAAFLVCAAFGVTQIGLLDPFSFLVRSLTVGILPLVQFALTGALWLIDRAGNDRASDIAGAAYDYVKNNYLYFRTPHFAQQPALAALFVAVIAMNFYRPRWWCRTVCPLGALLGTVARFSPVRLKVNDKCTHCMDCARRCEGACNPHKKDGWISNECLMCYNCVDTCPEKAVSFGMTLPSRKVQPPMDVGRRRVLAAGVTGLLAAPILRQEFFGKRVDPRLVRPPGSLPEQMFLEKCVKCGNCMRVCPTGFLQPALLEGGFEGFWTPIGVGKKGYCDYECTLCGQACPTGAIEHLPLPRKQKVKIGTACVDRSRCLTYAYGTPCAVCEEHCPTPQKAIWLETVETTVRGGQKIRIERPVVDPTLCIGCSNCENVCPVLDKPAINVTAIGESRSRENRLILGY